VISPFWAAKLAFPQKTTQRTLLDDCMAEGSQFELMVRFHFRTALQAKAPEKNPLVPAYLDLFRETGHSDARVIGAFWAAKLAFFLESSSEKIT